MYPALGQPPASIKILNRETNQPVPGTQIICSPYNVASKVPSETFYTDADGTAINTFPEKAIITIRAAGYQTINDTILPTGAKTIFISKLSVDLDEVVVTGQYDINTSDKSLYKVKVINNAAIQSMAAQDLTDVLSTQLNCRLAQDNILGSSVSINGISGQHVKILVDGVNVIGRENGNIDLSQLHMNNVDRIEIVEGPMSVSYGSDAIGGLINIVTRKSSSYGFEGDLNLYTESVGTYNADGGLFWNRNQHNLSLSGGRYFFNGYSQTDTSRFMEWKPKEQIFGAVGYQYSGKSIKISFKNDFLNQQIQNKGNPVLTPYQAYAFDDYYLTKRWNDAITAELRLKNGSRLQFINAYSYYSHIRNTYRMDLVTLEKSLLTGEEVQDTSAFTAWNFRGTYNQARDSRKLHYQGGYDINAETGNGNKLVNGRQTIVDYAIFGSLEYPLFDQFFIRPGLRISYNTKYGAPVAPSLNLKYTFKTNYTLRASYAHGFRAPSLKELDLYFVDVNHNILGNSNLKAETSNNYDLSLSLLKKAGAIGLNVEAGAFYNNISNIITLALTQPETQLYTYINIDKYQTTGATINASLKSKHFSFSSGFTITGLFNSLSDSFNVEHFSLTPEFSNNLTISFPEAGWEGGVFMKSTGTTPGYNIDAEGNIYQTTIAAYTIVDFSITKYLTRKRLAISAGLKNLLGVTDIQSNATAGTAHSGGSDGIAIATGRFVFGSVRFKFHKD